jgi:hypothetical protein
MTEEIGLASNTKEDPTQEGNLKMVQYMMKPGGMAFYGGITSRMGNFDYHDSLPYFNAGLFYVISLDNQIYSQYGFTDTIEKTYGFDKNVDDTEFYPKMSDMCSSLLFDANVVAGPHT